MATVFYALKKYLQKKIVLSHKLKLIDETSAARTKHKCLSKLWVNVRN